MTMFGFPQSLKDKNTQLKRNIIQSAIFQIKFKRNEQISSSKEKVTESLKSDFPNIKDIHQAEGAFKLNQDGTPILESMSSSSNGFELRTKDNLKVISLNNDGLVLTLAGQVYTKSSDVYTYFNEKILPLINDFDVDPLTRVSVRKINVLEANSNNDAVPNFRSLVELMNLVFNNQLTSNLSVMSDSNMLVNSISNITLVSPEGYKLILKYGVLPPRAEKPKSRQILLDIDVINAFKTVNSSDLIEEFTKLNNEVFNVFNWALNPEFMKQISGHYDKPSH